MADFTKKDFEKYIEERLVDNALNESLDIAFDSLKEYYHYNNNLNMDSITFDRFIENIEEINRTSGCDAKELVEKYVRENGELRIDYELNVRNVEVWEKCANIATATIDIGTALYDLAESLEKYVECKDDPVMAASALEDTFHLISVVAGVFDGGIASIVSEQFALEK